MAHPLLLLFGGLKARVSVNAYFDTPLSADASELRHFDGYDGTLVALVAEASTGTVAGLLEGVGGEQAVDDGDVAGDVEAGDASGDTLTDIVEMGCLATDDAAEDDDGVVAVVEGHLVCTVDELEGARDGLDVDILGQCAVTLEGGDAAVEECAGDVTVPLGDDDAEDHVRRVGNLGDVVLRQILCCHYLNDK